MIAIRTLIALFFLITVAPAGGLEAGLRTSTDNRNWASGDNVAESRKWREETGRMLVAMSREERMAYLSAARARYLSQAQEPAVPEDSCAVHEEPSTR